MQAHPAGYRHPGLMVETDWLAAHLNDASVRVVDMGMPDGYLRAHIPGAVHPGPERSHWLKDPGDALHVMRGEQFRALMEGWGVNDGMLVVAYDEDGCHQAARLWAVMRHYGSNQCRLLNGGWNKWLAEGWPANQAVVAYPKGSYTVKPGGRVFVQVEEMKSLVGSRDTQLLDVRSSGEWDGSVTRGNRRTGRIPGAKHLEWKEAVTDDGVKAFRPASQVLRKLDAAGVELGKPLVTYCQGGVRASHSAFVLTMLGHENVRVYDGSFAEWGNRDDTPIVK
jgi:thiosulfate/3-mercaptopyruvate sulfurtransferase